MRLGLLVAVFLLLVAAIFSYDTTPRSTYFIADDVRPDDAVMIHGLVDEYTAATGHPLDVYVSSAAPEWAENFSAWTAGVFYLVDNKPSIWLNVTALPAATAFITKHELRHAEQYFSEYPGNMSEREADAQRYARGEIDIFGQ